MNFKRAITYLLTFGLIFNLLCVAMPSAAMAEEKEITKYDGGALPEWISYTIGAGGYVDSWNITKATISDTIKFSKGSATGTGSVQQNHRRATLTINPEVWSNDIATMEFKIKSELSETESGKNNSSYVGNIQISDKVVMKNKEYFAMTDTVEQTVTLNDSGSQVWSKDIVTTRVEEQWTSIAITRNKSDKTLDVYINRIKAATFKNKTSEGEGTESAADNTLTIIFKYVYRNDVGSFVGNANSFMEIDDIKAYEGDYADGYKVSAMNMTIDGGISLGEISQGSDLTVNVDPGKLADSVTSAKYILTLRKGGRLIGMDVAEPSFDSQEPTDFSMTIENINPGGQIGAYELKLMVVDDFAKLFTLYPTIKMEE